MMSYLVIICLLFLSVASSTAQMELDHSDQQIQKRKDLQHKERINKKYKYLTPATKVSGGWFKSYEFDLRFPQIKDSIVSKNVFEGTLDFLGFKYTHGTEGKKTPKTDEDYQLIEKELPMVPTNFNIHTQNQIRYTWIGHATAVLQIGPDSFIIDPNFSDKKKRYRPPACQIKDLPKIDVVLISHDHYDHFDAKSVTQLQQRFKPRFIAGIGSEDILPKCSEKNLMDWMDEIVFKLKGGEYSITFVPACHWARRGMSDLNTRLWGGFIIETPFKQRIYYSGDTGYCEVFRQIGERFGPFDLSLLPIGAYQPRQLLKPQHINPDEAVRIHKQIKSKQSVGVHWGTLAMGRQGFSGPKYALKKACQEQGLKEGEFITVHHGASTIF